MKSPNSKTTKKGRILNFHGGLFGRKRGMPCYKQFRRGKPRGCRNSKKKSQSGRTCLGKRRQLGERSGFTTTVIVWGLADQRREKKKGAEKQGGSDGGKRWGGEEMRRRVKTKQKTWESLSSRKISPKKK